MENGSGMRRVLAAAVAALALTGCGSSIAITVPPRTTTTRSPTASASSTAPVSSAPDSSAPIVAGMPSDVRERLQASGVYELVAGTPELTWKTLKNVVVVGNSSTWVNDVARAAERRVAPLSALDGVPVKSSYLFLVPGNDATAKKWDSGDMTTRDFDGVTIPGFRETDPSYIVVMAQHTYDDGSSIASDPDYLDSLVQHEMFHASTLVDGAGGGDTPEWVIEGYAEWAGQNVTSVKPRKAPPARLPSDDEVIDDSDYGYFRAFMFVRYLVQTYGKDKALTFYRAAIDPDQEDVPGAFKATFGVPFATAEAAWKAQFTREFRNYDADFEYDD